MISRANILKAGTDIREGYFRLRVNQRLYVNAIVTLAAFLLSYAISGSSFSQSFFTLFIAFWCAAICHDLLALYKKVYETTLGKAFLVVLFSLCTNIAIVLSAQLVNDIVGIDPGKFPHTVALLSILFIPLFVAAGFGILYFILLFAIPLLLMLQMTGDDRAKEVFFPGYSASPTIPYQKITRTIQVVSFAVFCGVVYSLSQKVMHSYETFLSDTARSFLYQLEMYPKAPCNIEPGSRVAFISDEKVLVGVKGPNEITFKIRDCKSGGA